MQDPDHFDRPDTRLLFVCSMVSGVSIRNCNMSKLSRNCELAVLGAGQRY